MTKKVEEKRVQLKQEFYDELVRLKVKDKFLNNLDKNNKTFNENVNIINNIKSLKTALNQAFIWSKSNEGHNFWSKIHKKVKNGI